MAHICEITGKSRLKGHRVSHANNKTIHFQYSNVQDRHMFVPEIGMKTTVRVSPAGLRTLDKHGGLSRFLVKANPENLTPKLQRLRKVILQRGLR